MVRPAALASIAQIRRLGFKWPPSKSVGKTVDDHGVLVGVQLDLEATIERLRSTREYAEREQAQTRAFAAKWNAPIHDVTDRYDEHGENILAANEAIAALEKISRRVREAGPLPELEEDRAEALRARKQAEQAEQAETEARIAAPHVHPTPPEPVPAKPVPAEPARIEVVRASPEVVPPVAPDESRGGMLPAPIATSLFEDFARTLIRTLGLAWPGDVPSTSRQDEDSSSSSTATTWSHEGVTISIYDSVEVNQGPFDSPDRSWTANIGGLPGGCFLSFSSTYGVIHGFTILGDAPQRAEISHALARVLGDIARARSTVSRGILAPQAWRLRAATVDLARMAPVLHVHRWALEPLDASGGAWFAVAPGGEIGGTYGATVDPIGPLPRVLGIVYVGATRSAGSSEKAPPSVEQLGEVLAGVAPPSAAEEAQQRVPPDCARRFRAGPWVFQDSTYATGIRRCSRCASNPSRAARTPLSCAASTTRAAGAS